jgi:hypothetical protein
LRSASSARHPVGLRLSKAALVLENILARADTNA